MVDQTKRAQRNMNVDSNTLVSVVALVVSVAAFVRTLGREQFSHQLVLIDRKNATLLSLMSAIDALTASKVRLEDNQHRIPHDIIQTRVSKSIERHKENIAEIQLILDELTPVEIPRKADDRLTLRIHVTEGRARILAKSTLSMIANTEHVVSAIDLAQQEG